LNNHDAKPGRPAGQFDASGVLQTIEQALASAGLDTRVGPMKQVTDTIEQALSSAGLMPRRSDPRAPGMTIEGTAREVDPRSETPVALEGAASDAIVAEPTPDAPAPQPGRFLDRSFAGTAGGRAYKVYVPVGYSPTSGDPMPMVVMLHGCTQSPDDFAAGTRMNALADERGFIVVYPAQSAQANVQKCWNWFRTEDQVRESGEPAILAGITREVATTYRIDERRIFVAGMSAGAAMAVILGAMYPDLYAAVGAHSGLAYGAAHDVPSAFGAMHGASKSTPSAAIAVPTIVFHGDADRTVAARNAAAIIEQATARHDPATLRPETGSGTASGGRNYRRTVVRDASNAVVVEQWTLHGAGHAWSGGSAAGSFTDARGPDASREMIRFFYAVPRAGTA